MLSDLASDVHLVAPKLDLPILIEYIYVNLHHCRLNARKTPQLLELAEVKVAHTCAISSQAHVNSQWTRSLCCERMLSMTPEEALREGHAE